MLEGLIHLGFVFCQGLLLPLDFSASAAPSIVTTSRLRQNKVGLSSNLNTDCSEPWLDGQSFNQSEMARNRLLATATQKV
jgi:hypothetical protein